MVLKSKTYNGWTNYETWRMNVIIMNDENCYNTAIACSSIEELKEAFDCYNVYSLDGTGVNFDEIFESLEDFRN